MSKTMTIQSSTKHIPASLLTDFVSKLFAASGSSDQEAKTVTDHLIEANLKGHDSHGAIRTKKYVEWVRNGQLLPNQNITMIVNNPAIAVVDGNFGYGQVIGKEAMDCAIEKAKAIGFCALAIRNAGHLGRIGAWAEQLADAGLTSFHFVNTSGFGILVAPHGGSDRRLSANPIAAGVPVRNGKPIILDIATSIVAEGKIQISRNKQEQLQPGLVIDGQGNPTTDPERFYAHPPGAIFPFGGHKGSGLSFMCEILAGSLTGGASSHPENKTASRLVNNMLTLAFDPSAFAADFFDADVARLMAWTKASPPIEQNGEVLLPGEIESKTHALRSQHGIPMDAETLRQLAEVAHSFGIPVPPEMDSLNV